MKFTHVITAIVCVGIVASCSKLPQTRYYQLAAPEGTAGKGSATIAIEPLATEGGYDDDRIVYRTTPYRFDYYDYHRWSSTPGSQVTAFLERALENTGRFRAIVREPTDATPIVLGGRVIAIEEVDVSPTHWMGRIIIELTATDSTTGEIVWSERFTETEPLATRDPEGLTQALSKALGRIAARAAPVVGNLADRAAVASRLEAATRG